MMGKLLYFKSWQFQASVAELVDALDLKSNWYLNASAGSSPARGTCKPLQFNRLMNCRGFFF